MNKKGDVEMLKGKRLSILGDSISTYCGVSNDARANATTIYNPYFYKEPFPLERTYWRIVMDRFGLELCVNNSWSGGNLSGTNDVTSGVSRSAELARDNGESPDLIIVFMGINDLGRNVEASVFAESYEKTLITIRDKYPTAKVCCVNLPDRDVFLKARAELFNEKIQSIVESMGEEFFIAALFHSRLNNDFYYMNPLDGLHPDEDGMRHIADIIEESIIRYFTSI